MKHINSISDLDPKSEGFANRGAESITIIGHVLEDILNGFGSAISGITGQSHGSHLDNRISFEQANTGNIQAVLTPEQRARIRAVDATVPKTFTIGFKSDTSRLQNFVDERF